MQYLDSKKCSNIYNDPMSQYMIWKNILKIKDFQNLSYSTFSHWLGFGMEHVALGWLIVEITDSSFMVGVAMAIRMVPLFVFGVFSGFFADNFDRRIMLRFVTLISAFIPVFLGVLLIFEAINIFFILVFYMFSGTAFAFVLTLRQTYIYDVVGENGVVTGLSLLQIFSQFGGIFGSLISGWLIQEFSVGIQYIVIGVCYLGSFLLLLNVNKTGQFRGDKSESFKSSVTNYFKLLKNHSILITLMILVSMSEIFGFTHMTLIPVFSKDVLNLGAFGLGVLTSIRQLGGFTGLIALTVFDSYKSKGLLVLIITVIFGLTQITAYFATSFIAFGIILFLINACAMSADTLFKSLMQISVPNKDRGTAMGSWVLSIGTAPLGHLGLGAIGNIWGSPFGFLFNGIILFSTGVVSIVTLKKVRMMKL